jgi:heterodisulfide reductase subunit A2
MKERIGVYICHCGGNISDYVDTDIVREAVKDLESVHIAKDVMFACADSTQKEIVEDIKQQQLDGIVIASCSPKLHLFTFRNVAIRAGINPYNYVQANIREQCSWTHTDKPKEATEKAIHIIKGAIQRVKHSQALEGFEIPAHNTVLVVGAGVAGMRAAITLSKMGSKVVLIEKSHFVGGNTALMGELFTTDEKGEEIVKALYLQIKQRDNITLFTGAELIETNGSVGNFTVKINIKPRFIKPNADYSKLMSVVQSMKGETYMDERNFGLTNRKAVYMPNDAVPQKPVVFKPEIQSDFENLKLLDEWIDLNQNEETVTLNTGAILVSTGFDIYEPKIGEYGFKESPQVITLQQLKRLIELNQKEKLTYLNKEIKNIVFIYCVGSRQIEDGENRYCSRYCCTSAIHTSLLLKKKYKNIHNYHLYRDIRTYGKQELLYDESSLKGDIYCKYDAENPPIVSIKNNELCINFRDLLYDNEEFEIQPDLVVLVTGMIPKMDSHDISSILKIPIGKDKFYNEIHPKLKPVETVIDGVFIAGACQGPKNVTESMISALAAASKANSLIHNEKIKLEPTIITVNHELCSWCGKCDEICPYGAFSKLTLDNNKVVASVNKSVCKGCGICAPVCPENAIDIVGYTDNQIESMIEGLIKM